MKVLVDDVEYGPFEVPEDNDFHTVLMTFDADGAGVTVELDGLEQEPDESV